MRKNENKEYLIATLYYLVGNFVGQGVVLLSSSIFTRIMDKQAFGMVNTYSAWVLVINTFICLNLFITVRNAYIDYRECYKEFQSSILLLALIAFAFLSGVILLGVKFLRKDVDLFPIFLALLQAFSVHTVNLRMAVLAMENDYKHRTLYMTLPNVFHTILSIVLIFLYVQNSYYAKIIGNALGIFVFAFVAIAQTFYNAKPTINKEFWKYATMISVPAIMCTMSDLLLMQSDRIMITSMVGAEETAVYSLIYNIGSIIVALYTAINGAWTSWFYQKIAEKSYGEIKKIQGLYVVGFAILSGGILTISPEIIKILSPKSYWNGLNYVNLIVLSSFLIFLYTFYTTYLMYMKKTGIVAINTMISAILNILLNYILIPKYHSVGAAGATIISYVVLYILHGFVVKKDSKKFFERRITIISTVVLILYSLIFYFIKDLWLIRYSIIIVTAIIVGISIYKLYWSKRGK